MNPGQVSMSAPLGISSALGGRFSEVSDPGFTPAYEDSFAKAVAAKLPNAMTSTAMMDVFPTPSG
jgi:hypothetical protein